MAFVRTFKTKPVTMKGVEIKHTITVDGNTFVPGDFLLTDDNNNQFYATAAQVAADFDEVQPRTRKPADIPTNAPAAQ